MITRLNSIGELSKLPYFRKNENGLTVIKKGLLDYKIIDMHTHLGWNFPVRRKLDLWEQPRINYVYSDKTKINLKRHSALDFEERLDHKEREIISGVISIKKYSCTYTIPNILQEMNRLGVEKSIILSLKIPLMANNTLNNLNSINKNYLSWDRLFVFGSLNPKSINKRGKLNIWKKMGMKGLKLHPLFNFFKPTDKGAYRIYELAEEFGLPILFHTGLSPAAPQYLKRFVEFANYKKVVEDFPRVKFILGHGGGYSDWRGAIELVKKYKNAYLETSGQSPGVIGEFIKKVDNERIMYGSDWPFYPMALSLVKVFIATEGNSKARKKILRENAERFF